MQYTSTRDKSIRVSAATAIAQGISEEGGLFVPCELPHFSLDSIGKWFRCHIQSVQKQFSKNF